ncbi:MAG: Lrp/AsnC family transcriptional regulator [Christensenella sp.]|uniref:Lrp/AsnC family transcriptional regulator n=1 Tax=Christensenella sp. TaxID=1935934 RepID=UPI002B1FD6DE|nr:Lrp/AsnC family transcriptional regulator [Christensenella sp.]MEA5002328.1 Lrp/AsnC family transcriptional regulator [Christensenella sp.]
MERDLKLEILDILEDNAKTTAEEIAMMLDAPAAVVQKTIDELEEQQAIVKYSALINREIVSDEEDAEALIEVEVTPQRDYGYDDLAKRIYRFEEVRAVYLMAGTYDLCVRIKSRSMKDISKFVFEKLAVIDGVTRTVTVFIMRKYKEQGVILVGDETDERLVVTP